MLQPPEPHRWPQSAPNKTKLFHRAKPVSTVCRKDTFLRNQAVLESCCNESCWFITWWDNISKVKHLFISSFNKRFTTYLNTCFTWRTTILVMCLLFMVCSVLYHADILSTVLIFFKVLKPVVSVNCDTNPLLLFGALVGTVRSSGGGRRECSLPCV